MILTEVVEFRIAHVWFSAEISAALYMSCKPNESLKKVGFKCSRPYNCPMRDTSDRNPVGEGSLIKMDNMLNSASNQNNFLHDLM